MNKKSFKNNPAMAFISTDTQESAQYQAQENTPYDAQQDTQIDIHYDAQIGVQQNAQVGVQQNTPQDTQQKIVTNRPGYVRTQGRKGHKKPRINLAFDSDELLDRIRAQSNKEGKSVTQFVNEALVIHLNNL